MIDFHTHILPGIDDGFKNIDDSLNALESMCNNGIRIVVATPHFDAYKDDLNTFLLMREQSYRQITEAAQSRSINIPEIILGAEVTYYSGISQYKDISKLCISDTKYMLLEMPFSKWGQLIIQEIQNLMHTHNIVPIIAHIERYPHYKTLLKNKYLQVPIQANAESLLRFKTSRFLMKQLRNGTIQVLGSDCHNATSRPPNMHLAIDKIEQKLGIDYIHQLEKVWRLMADDKAFD